ncbi:MAG: M20/M25/M40 family metallo-hydrolase [Woeseiaceae bacterium]|nr:M20/M25/M40 family metallo-hydrolase [Woeseiaceae bacterium]
MTTQGLVLLAVASVALGLAGPAGAGLTQDEQRMLEWIDAHAGDAVALLEETVNIGSGTMNHAGIREVGRVMRRELDAVGLETRWIDMPAEMQRAGHLFGRKDGDGPKFLLIGHLDTVFEADDAFDAFRREGNIGHGPGVDDMKSGNVIIVFALKALASIGALDAIPVVVAYTGDEENVGDPIEIARRDQIEAGRWADIALGFEGAVTRDGADWATISRRSSSEWLLETTGRQAHSSGVFNDRVGAGAIYEAARILAAFYGELRGESYLTFNAGNIQGGTMVTYDEELRRGTSFGKTNVVAQKAIVHGDLRTISAEQLASVQERMRAIVAINLPQTTATIRFRDKYPPMAPTDGNRRLADRLSAINVDLGRGPMEILDPMQRGAADISFVAPYADALAGLGALGSGAHSPDETVELDSLPLAIKRAALLIYRSSRGAGGPAD